MSRRLPPHDQRRHKAGRPPLLRRNLPRHRRRHARRGQPRRPEQPNKDQSPRRHLRQTPNRDRRGAGPSAGRKRGARSPVARHQVVRPAQLRRRLPRRVTCRSSARAVPGHGRPEPVLPQRAVQPRVAVRPRQAVPLQARKHRQQPCRGNGPARVPAVRWHSRPEPVLPQQAAPPPVEHRPRPGARHYQVHHRHPRHRPAARRRLVPVGGIRPTDRRLKGDRQPASPEIVRMPRSRRPVWSHPARSRIDRSRPRPLVLASHPSQGRAGRCVVSTSCAVSAAR